MTINWTNCPNCAAPVNPEETQCPYCGTPYPVEMTAATPNPSPLRFDGAQVVAGLMAGILTANEARRLLGLREIKED